MNYYSRFTNGPPGSGGHPDGKWPFYGVSGNPNPPPPPIIPPPIPPPASTQGATPDSQGYRKPVGLSGLGGQIP